MSAAVHGGYNTTKDFKGKRYTGMSVGAKHHWNYSDARFDLSSIGGPDPNSRLGMLTPVTSSMAYESVKSRLNAAPIGSGAAVDTVYHWFIVSELNFTEPGKATLRGPKYKLGHKRPHWNKFSSEYAGNTPVPAKRVEVLKDLLGDAPPTEYAPVDPSAVALPSYQASRILQSTNISLPMTETTWIEQKVGPDEWRIAVDYSFPAESEEASILLGSKFLIVADQYATKLNANQYATQMSGSSFYLGEQDQVATKIKLLSAIIRMVSEESLALTEKKIPSNGPVATPTPPKPITAFWSGPDAPLVVVPKRVAKRKRDAPAKGGENGDQDSEGALSKKIKPLAYPLPEAETKPLDAAEIQALEDARTHLELLSRELSPEAGIVCVPGWIDSSNSVELFDQLVGDVAWAGKRIRGSVVPRLVADSYASGTSPVLDQLLPNILSSFGMESGSISLSLFRTGADHLTKDDAAGLYSSRKPKTAYVHIVLGAPRKVVLSPKTSGKPLVYDLCHGDLFVVDTAVTSKYEITIPPVKASNEPTVGVVVTGQRVA